MSNSTIGVRISRETRDLLDKISKVRGEDLSSFVRRAILKELGYLGFLSKEQEKALELKPSNQTKRETEKRKLYHGGL